MGNRTINIVLALLVLGALLGCQKRNSVPNPVWDVPVPKSLQGPELVYGSGLPPGELPAGDQQGRLAPPPDNGEEP
jgi:hypothetical protein